jgi:hypothetical protein
MAVKQLANFSARLPGKADGKGCRERLPGKAGRQGYRARLPGKGYRATQASPYCHITSLNLFGLVWTAARTHSVEPVRTCLDSRARKAARQARTRLHAMVQYAESMVKLVKNAVF